MHLPSLRLERRRAPEFPLGRRSPKHFRDLASEFGRRLRIELQKVVELFGVKNATISIDDVHMPSGLRQSPSSRHRDYTVYIERSLALAVFPSMDYERRHGVPDVAVCTFLNSHSDRRRTVPH